MSKKVEQLELPFGDVPFDSHAYFVEIPQAAAVLCLNTHRIERHISNTYNLMVLRGFAAPEAKGLKVG